MQADKKVQAAQRKAEAQARNKAKAEEAAARRKAEEAAEREAVAVGMGGGELKGDRGSMEDCVVARMLPSGERFCAVFDGHFGDTCAAFCKTHLHETLQACPFWFAFEDAHALQVAFAETHAHFVREASGSKAGTTATVALIRQGVLHVASVGNSCAVLCSAGRATRLTSDEKPDVPPPGIMGGEAPQLVTRELTSTDVFIVIASDGVWDVLSPQKACDLVQTSLKAEANPGAPATACVPTSGPAHLPDPPDLPNRSLPPPELAMRSRHANPSPQPASPASPIVSGLPLQSLLQGRSAARLTRRRVGTTSVQWCCCVLSP